MTSVLVTGAGGFVCSNIIEVLLEHGCHVVAVDRAFDPERRAAWEGRAVEMIESDAQDLPDIAVDYLVHGAAITASPEERGETPESNFRANIDPLLAALDWAARQRIKRGLFISSGGVFSQNTAPVPLVEDTPVVPYGLYAVAKKTMEDTVTTLSGLYNRPLVTIRLSNVYGLFERPRPTRVRTSLVSRLIHEAMTQGSMTVPLDAPKRDWTLASDVGRAVYALLHQSPLDHTLYHVTSGQTVTPLEVAQAIQTLIPEAHIKSDETPMPNRAGWLASQYDPIVPSWTPFEDGLKQIIDLERVS